MPSATDGNVIVDSAQVAPGSIINSDLADNTILNAKINSAAGIVRTKLANVSATARLIGRKTAGAGTDEEITIEEALNFFASIAQGDILYRGASGFERLAAGSAGQFLKTLGAGANPAWAAAGETWLVKTSTETVNGSSTLQNDDVFTFSVSANKIYKVRLVILLTTTTNAAWRCQWSLPASAVHNCQVQKGNAQADGSFDETGDYIYGAAATDRVVTIDCILNIGATAGTATFQWAQQTGDASDTQIIAGSYLSYLALN